MRRSHHCGGRGATAMVTLTRTVVSAVAQINPRYREVTSSVATGSQLMRRFILQPTNLKPTRWHGTLTPHGYV